MPPWKHRRRLIYATCILAAGMIIFAAATFRSDTNVSSQLIVGGVGLLSITLTAYTGFATWEDSRLWQSAQEASQKVIGQVGEEEEDLSLYEEQS